jgi:putative PIN family toxin of toxin-antitoxin system
MKRRVLFDTSTLVGAALRKDSVPYLALYKAFALDELYISKGILEELNVTLHQKRFDRYVSIESRDNFLSTVSHEGHLFPVTPSDIAGIYPRCRDVNDNHILALAQVAEVAVIVSSDSDLPVLNPWNGIPILTPAEFLAQAENSEPLESEHS